jgi:hypothetical protein
MSCTLTLYIRGAFDVHLLLFKEGQKSSYFITSCRNKKRKLLLGLKASILSIVRKKVSTVYVFIIPHSTSLREFLLPYTIIAFINTQMLHLNQGFFMLILDYSNVISVKNRLLKLSRFFDLFKKRAVLYF